MRKYKMTRRELTKLILSEIKQNYHLNKVLGLIQAGLLNYETPNRKDHALEPKDYPSGINQACHLLTNEQQAVINQSINSQAQVIITTEEVIESFYNDTIIEQAKAIADGRSDDIEGYFVYQNYEPKIITQLCDIEKFNIMIITNDTVEWSKRMNETENIEIKPFKEAKADFVKQYKHVKQIREGLQSYCEEIKYFKKEPEWFEKIEAEIKRNRQAIIADTKEKKELLRVLTNLEKQLTEAKAKHAQLNSEVKRIGRFILDSKKAKRMNDLEKQILKIQGGMTILNMQLEDVNNTRKLRTTELAKLRAERQSHIDARKEIDKLVILDGEQEKAGWNTEQFNSERLQLFKDAIILIKSFKKEMVNKGILYEWQPRLLTYELFERYYDRYKAKELGTIIVDKTISDTKALYCAIHGKRSLVIRDQSSNLI